ncbi:hypothetical protein HID58_013442 [Brassica napus]|uniref:Uncharacterized protein n=1 Tax=Brassica napus TaxID=3708 RepID=A0ABQ8E6N1_BRANA|nr:hypothetical protein HID58_013442 [Brassica napus]
MESLWASPFSSLMNWILWQSPNKTEKLNELYSNDDEAPED